MSTEFTGQKQAEESHKGQFKKGQSGNPGGRPKGSRNRATLAAEALLDGEAEALSRTAIVLALDGDTVALRLCLERLIPVRRSRLVTFDLPTTSTAQDIVCAHDAVLAAVSDGELSPEEGEVVMGLLERKRMAIETADLADDLEIMKSQLETIKERMAESK